MSKYNIKTHELRNDQRAMKFAYIYKTQHLLKKTHRCQMSLAKNNSDITSKYSADTTQLSIRYRNVTDR